MYLHDNNRLNFTFNFFKNRVCFKTIATIINKVTTNRVQSNIVTTLPIGTEVKWRSNNGFKWLQYTVWDVQKWLNSESGTVAKWYSNEI